MLAPLEIVDQLKARLGECLADLADQAPRTGAGAGEFGDDGVPPLLSLVLPLPRVPTAAPQLEGPLFQLQRAHGSELRAGYGSAIEWAADGPLRLQRLARIGARLRPRWRRLDPDESGLDAFAMLGFAASPDAAPQVEDHLPNAILWVPEIGLTVQQGEAALVLSAAGPVSGARLQRTWEAALERLVPRLYPPLTGPLTAARLQREFAEPDLGGWTALVEDALAEIAADGLQKVVLSRRLDVRGPRCFDIGRLVGALGCLFPTCQIVNLRRNGKSFVAATPERLLRQCGGHLTVDAIAGTAARAEDAERDAALSEALLGCDKNLREHRHVIEAITEALSDCCESIAAPSRPEVMQLTNAHHLWSPIDARTRPGLDVFALAERLHPTPATNGRPRGRAQEWLRVAEPFDRGWYTGAAGIVHPDLSGELWVLLRCARVCGDRAELYAGAGIVAGSDAASEWQETEAKLQAMLTALQYA